MELPRHSSKGHPITMACRQPLLPPWLRPAVENATGCARVTTADLKAKKPPCSLTGCGHRSWAAGVCRWHRVNGGKPIKPVRPRVQVEHSPGDTSGSRSLRSVRLAARRSQSGLGPTAVMSEVGHGPPAGRPLNCRRATPGRQGRHDVVDVAERLRDRELDRQSHQPLLRAEDGGGLQVRFPTLSSGGIDTFFRSVRVDFKEMLLADESSDIGYERSQSLQLA